LSSEALQHGLSSLHLLIPIPDGWEKEEEAARIKKKKKISSGILNFMISFLESFHEPDENHD
jgi:hypothetical protein